MSQVEISEAQSDLLGLVERARSGEDVTLTNHGRVGARLLPIADTPIVSPAAALVGTLPLHYRDRFDRLLIAQALQRAGRPANLGCNS